MTGGTERKMVNLGLGRRCINPTWPVAISGYGPDRISAGIHDDIFVKCAYLASGDTHCLLISADLLGFSEAMVDRLRAALQERHGLQPSQVLIAATHTHSGPSSLAGHWEVSWPVDERYLTWLEEQTLAAAADAVGSACPCRLRVTSDTCDVVINRRLKVAGEWQLLPNEAGLRDEEVLVLIAEDSSGTPLAVLFQYSCHPTVVCTELISGDFVGRAQSYVEERLPGCTALFFQGFEGDVRPRMVTADGAAWRTATWDDVEELGAKLGEAVLRAAAAPGRRITGAPITAAELTFDLPFSEVPTEAELQAAAQSDDPGERAWGNLLLSEGLPPRPGAECRLQRISIGDELHFMAMNGEVCLGYALKLKEWALARGETIIPVGIANGLIQYIPTREIRLQGGYGSSIPFKSWGLAGPFAPEVEDIITDRLADLLGQ